MGKVVTDMGGAWMMAMVLIGDELGLYKAMGDGKATTAEALAERCSCHPRLVREWLDANAASGYLEVADGAYRLPPEQAMALANQDSPVFVAPGQSVVASCFMDLDKVLQAFRGNGAFPWGAHHHRMFHGVEQFFRPGYQANLTTAWLPALDGVVDKLKRGAKVADVGCGHGASTIVMAKAYPNSRFVGIDFHKPSVEIAGRRAADAGVGGRVSFITAAAQTYTERDFDLICFFDCLHDMGDPVGAARHARQALKDDGTVLLVSHSRATVSPRTRRRSGACTTRRPPWSARRTPCRRKLVSGSAHRPAKCGSRRYSRRPASQGFGGRRRRPST